MSRLTQIRLDAITGSLTSIESSAGSVSAGAPASGFASDLEGVLGHFAGAIKRITGAPTFTGQNQGHFSTDLNVTGSLTVINNVTGSGALFSGDARVNGQLRVVTGIRNTGTVNQGFNNLTANFNFTTQSFVGVDTSLGAYTGTLPTIAGDYIGRVFSIKDIGGLCGTTPFVITASSPNKIDGATELKINTTSGSVSLIAGVNGASYNWYIMSYT